MFHSHAEHRLKGRRHVSPTLKGYGASLAQEKTDISLALKRIICLIISWLSSCVLSSIKIKRVKSQDSSSLWSWYIYSSSRHPQSRSRVRTLPLFEVGTSTVAPGILSQDQESELFHSAPWEEIQRHLCTRLFTRLH